MAKFLTLGGLIGSFLGTKKQESVPRCGTRLKNVLPGQDSMKGILSNGDRYF
jgi:hypothetical protein